MLRSPGAGSKEVAAVIALGAGLARARLTGRFPVEIHGGGGGHRHRALLHVEVHPR